MFFKFISSFIHFRRFYVFYWHFIVRPRAYDKIVISDREIVIVLFYSDFFSAIVRYLKKWSLDERDLHIVICDSCVQIPYDFIVFYAEAFEKVRVLGCMWHRTNEFKEGVPIDHDYFDLVIEMCLLIESFD